ncbi:Protein kinase domain [Trinorchestia longiramus]|nr:Protein kinase domain [Trinorchestia longiramus]
MDQYVMLRVLGEGSFGSAVLARYRASSELLVLKRIPLKKLSPQAVVDAMKEVQLYACDSIFHTMDQYVMLRVLGEGSFGSAVLARYRASSELLVLKRIPLKKLSPQAVVDAMKEVQVLSSLNHPHITQFKHSFEWDGELIIAMEYCGGGDLRTILHQRAGVLFPQDRILDWFVQLCLAVKYIHDRHVLHRDIKSQNVFLTEGGKIKLGDFGISKVLESSKELASTCIGTPYYLSPEMCQNKPYNSKSDVWALGCVLYEMAALKHPFEANCMKTLVMKIMKGSYRPISSKFSWDLKALIRQILQSNPTHRPSVTTILAQKIMLDRVPKFLEGIDGNNDLLIALRELKDAERALSKGSLSVSEINGPAAKYGASISIKKPGRKSSPLKNSRLAKCVLPKNKPKCSPTRPAKQSVVDTKQHNLDGLSAQTSSRKRIKSRSVDGFRIQRLSVSPRPLSLVENSRTNTYQGMNSVNEANILPPTVELILKNINKGKYCGKTNSPIKEKEQQSLEHTFSRKRSVEYLLNDDRHSLIEDADFNCGQDGVSPSIHVSSNVVEDELIKPSKCAGEKRFCKEEDDIHLSEIQKPLNDVDNNSKETEQQVMTQPSYPKRLIVQDLPRSVELKSTVQLDVDGREGFTNEISRAFSAPINSLDTHGKQSNVSRFAVYSNHIDLANKRSIPKNIDVGSSDARETSIMSSTPVRNLRNVWCPWNPTPLSEAPLETTRSKMDSTTSADEVIVHYPATDIRIRESESVFMNPGVLQPSDTSENISSSAILGFGHPKNQIVFDKNCEMQAITTLNVSPICHRSRSKEFIEVPENSKETGSVTNDRRQWLKVPSDDILDILSSATVHEATLDSMQTSVIIDSLLSESSPRKSQRCSLTKVLSIDLNSVNSCRKSKAYFSVPQSSVEVKESEVNSTYGRGQPCILDRTFTVACDQDERGLLYRTYLLCGDSIAKKHNLAICVNKSSDPKLPRSITLKPQKRLLNFLLRRESLRKKNVKNKVPSQNSAYVENITKEKISETIDSSDFTPAEARNYSEGTAQAVEKVGKSRRSFSDFLRKITSQKLFEEKKVPCTYNLDAMFDSSLEKHCVEPQIGSSSEIAMQSAIFPAQCEIRSSSCKNSLYAGSIEDIRVKPTETMSSRSSLPFDTKAFTSGGTSRTEESGYYTNEPNTLENAPKSEIICQVFNSIGGAAENYAESSVGEQKILQSPSNSNRETKPEREDSSCDITKYVVSKDNPGEEADHSYRPLDNEYQPVACKKDGSLTIERKRQVRRLAEILVSNIIGRAEEKYSANLTLASGESPESKCNKLVEEVDQKSTKNPSTNLNFGHCECVTKSFVTNNQTQKSGTSQTHDNVYLKVLSSLEHVSNTANPDDVHAKSNSIRCSSREMTVDNISSCLWSTLIWGCGAEDTNTPTKNSVPSHCCSSEERTKTGTPVSVCTNTTNSPKSVMPTVATFFTESTIDVIVKPPRKVDTSCLDESSQLQILNKLPIKEGVFSVAGCTSNAIRTPTANQHLHKVVSAVDLLPCSNKRYDGSHQYPIFDSISGKRRVYDVAATAKVSTEDLGLRTSFCGLILTVSPLYSLKSFYAKKDDFSAENKYNSYHSVSEAAFEDFCELKEYDKLADTAVHRAYSSYGFHSPALRNLLQNLALNRILTNNSTVTSSENSVTENEEVTNKLVSEGLKIGISEKITPSNCIQSVHLTPCSVPGNSSSELRYENSNDLQQKPISSQNNSTVARKKIVDNERYPEEPCYTSLKSLIQLDSKQIKQDRNDCRDDALYLTKNENTNLNTACKTQTRYANAANSIVDDNTPIVENKILRMLNGLERSVVTGDYSLHSALSTTVDVNSEIQENLDEPLTNESLKERDSGTFAFKSTKKYQEDRKCLNEKCLTFLETCQVSKPVLKENYPHSMLASPDFNQFLSPVESSDSEALILEAAVLLQEDEPRSISMDETSFCFLQTPSSSSIPTPTESLGREAPVVNVERLSASVTDEPCSNPGFSSIQSTSLPVKFCSNYSLLKHSFVDAMDKSLYSSFTNSSYEADGCSSRSFSLPSLLPSEQESSSNSLSSIIRLHEFSISADNNASINKVPSSLPEVLGKTDVLSHVDFHMKNPRILGENLFENCYPSGSSKLPNRWMVRSTSNSSTSEPNLRSQNMDNRSFSTAKAKNSSLDNGLTDNPRELTHENMESEDDIDVFGWIEEQRATMEEILGLDVFVTCHKAAVAAAAQAATPELFEELLCPVLHCIVSCSSCTSGSAARAELPAALPVQSALHVGYSEREIRFDSLMSKPPTGCSNVSEVSGDLLDSGNNAGSTKVKSFTMFSCSKATPTDSSTVEHSVNVSKSEVPASVRPSLETSTRISKSEVLVGSAESELRSEDLLERFLEPRVHNALSEFSPSKILLKQEITKCPPTILKIEDSRQQNLSEKKLKMNVSECRPKSDLFQHLPKPISSNNTSISYPSKHRPNILLFKNSSISNLSQDLSKNTLSVNTSIHARPDFAPTSCSNISHYEVMSPNNSLAPVCIQNVPHITKNADLRLPLESRLGSGDSLVFNNMPGTISCNWKVNESTMMQYSRHENAECCNLFTCAGISVTRDSKSSDRLASSGGTLSFHICNEAIPRDVPKIDASVDSALLASQASVGSSLIVSMACNTEEASSTCDHSSKNKNKIRECMTSKDSIASSFAGCKKITEATDGQSPIVFDHCIDNSVVSKKKCSPMLCKEDKLHNVRCPEEDRVSILCECWDTSLEEKLLQEPSKFDVLSGGDFKLEYDDRREHSGSFLGCNHSLVIALSERLRAGSKPGNEYELFLVSRRELALIEKIFLQNFKMAEEELDIKDYYIEDKDVCTETELAEIFPVRYRVCKKNPLVGCTNNKTFVKIALSSNEELLSVGSKMGDVNCLDGTNGSLVSNFRAHEKEITGLQYCPTNMNLLYSCSSDSTIKLRDLRSGRVEQTYEHKNESHKELPFTCLSVNMTGEFLCAGTSFVDDEACLVFWDVRKQHKLLGSYTDSHSDDVTALHFHPQKRSELASAAMDNLINIFDISKPSESEAFHQCVNFETTPDAVTWDKHANYESKLFAVNHPQIIQWWDIDDTKPSANMKPKIYCKALKRSVPDQCHFISLNFYEKLDPLLMFSSNLGLTSHENACIRTLQFNRDKKKLLPHADFELQANEMVEVCDSVFLSASDVFVTLENTCLKYWSRQTQKRTALEDSASTNISQKLKKQKL